METNQSPFSFLAVKTTRTKQPIPNSDNLAWCEDYFHLNGNNYFIYTCHSCQTKQIKKGKPPLNWGG